MNAGGASVGGASAGGACVGGGSVGGGSGVRSVTVERRTAGDVPLLVARPADQSGPLPLVLWFHGFRAEAAANQAELVRLAELGFLAVGVDAVGHGARRDPDLDARVAASPHGARPIMLAQVRETAGEIPAIVGALAGAGLARPCPVAVVGVSMGGYLAYLAPLVEPDVSCVVALLGAPEWPDGDGPHRRADVLRGVALLSITAERDASVPPDAARRLHARLDALDRRDPRGRPQPLPPQRYLELPGAPHLLAADEWATAMQATRDWLDRHAR